MKINDKNKWIAIVDEQAVPGAGGKILTSAVTVVETWAAIWPLRAKEARENMRTGASTTHDIRIGYRDGIKSNMRVVYNGRSFEIKSIINPEEADVELHLLCEERL